MEDNNQANPTEDVQTPLTGEAANIAASEQIVATESVQANQAPPVRKPSSTRQSLFIVSASLAALIAIFKITDYLMIRSGSGDSGMIGFVFLLIPFGFAMPVLIVLDLVLYIKGKNGHPDYLYLLSATILILAMLGLYIN